MVNVKLYHGILGGALHQPFMYKEHEEIALGRFSEGQPPVVPGLQCSNGYNL